MLDSRNLLAGKSKYLFGLVLLSFVSVCCVAFRMHDDEDFNISRREVLLRRLGHEILLQSGDRTSRVLPVKKIAKDEYQISFERAFTFQPDSLVHTTQRLLARDPLASDYVVNVLNCANASVAYGYAISNSRKDDIVACDGRIQPTACYIVNIKFKPAGIISAKTGYLLGSLPLLAFVGFIFLRAVKPQNAPSAGRHPTGLFTLGAVLFDSANHKLIIDGKTTELTGTETRLLHIFAMSPNETIARSRLQKEIWEDEGIIVGRSLDMFISKLRKKLETDPHIRIAVIRGKGYKLEISA